MPLAILDGQEGVHGRRPRDRRMHVVVIRRTRVRHGAKDSTTGHPCSLVVAAAASSHQTLLSWETTNSGTLRVLSSVEELAGVASHPGHLNCASARGQAEANE